MPKTKPLDLAAIEETWLQPCGACDAGLPMNCTHPEGDYRPVMLELVTELRRYRANGKPRSRRNQRSARKAGTAFAEFMVARYLRQQLGNDGIERRDKNGHKDRGDITGVKYAGQRVVIEAKDYGGEFLVGTWLEEADRERGNDDAGVGMVIAKRRGHADPGDQVVLMTLRDLVSLMTGTRPGEESVSSSVLPAGRQPQ